MNNQSINYLHQAGVKLTLAFSVILLMSWVSIDSIPKSFKKKINKTIFELWPGTPELRDFSVTDEKKIQFEKAGVISILEVFEGESQLGFTVLAKARSKFEYFDYVIYYDQNKVIKAVRVLLYREDYGGEIASKRWLKQFDGKTVQSPIQIDEDIQGISGATISYRAITLGVKNITQLMNTL